MIAIAEGGEERGQKLRERFWLLKKSARREIIQDSNKLKSYTRRLFREGLLRMVSSRSLSKQQIGIS
jgi:hypothetical protein